MYSTRLRLRHCRALQVPYGVSGGTELRKLGRGASGWELGATSAQMTVSAFGASTWCTEERFGSETLIYQCMNM